MVFRAISWEVEALTECFDSAWAYSASSLVDTHQTTHKRRAICQRYLFLLKVAKSPAIKSCFEVAFFQHSEYFWCSSLMFTLVTLPPFCAAIRGSSVAGLCSTLWFYVHINTQRCQVLRTVWV